MAKSVEAVFFNRATKTNFAGKVRLPTSGGGSAHTATIACNDYAWDDGYTHWAHAAKSRLVACTDAWLVFECRGRSSRVFLTEVPTQAAAEMWMVHRG